MQPLMGADTPNDAAIIAQIDKVVQARADLERANARFLLAIRDKLTADQWKQIQTVQQDRRSERWRRMAARNALAAACAGNLGPNQQQGPPPPPPANCAPEMDRALAWQIKKFGCNRFFKESCWQRANYG